MKESDAGRYRKPVEVTEQGRHMGEFGQIENGARHSVLDMLQRFSHRCWESSQEQVAVVQVEDDQFLDQELRFILCEERPKSADVVGCRTVCRRGLRPGSSQLTKAIL